MLLPWLRYICLSFPSASLSSRGEKDLAKLSNYASLHLLPFRYLLISCFDLLEVSNTTDPLLDVRVLVQT